MSADVFEARMRAVASDVLADVRHALLELEPRARHARVGRVVAVGDGIAHVAGLEHPFAGELLDVGGVDGIAEELRENEVRVVLLGASHEVQAGETVRRLGRVVEVPAGPELIGRIVDPLARPLDGRGPILSRRQESVHPAPTPLVDREPVRRALRTGIFSLDTMIPIGRGQRQLIIGDRATGKTELGLEILCAMDPAVIGVYVAIGRRGADTSANIEWLRNAGFFEHGFSVVTDADDPPGLVHLTPYAACTMAEELAEAGHDVVIVFDDLTVHANVHRTLALLLGRPVGREAYPADVFHAHARLLERATQLSDARGGGSLTAFPIVETQAGDLAGFIPTNMVSITDGQVRLDADLVAADIKPAVDVALSVSRVGGKAQPLLVRALAATFKNKFSQFLELESFARFGTRLEPTAQAIVDWGRRVRLILRQGRGVSRSWADTVARLLIAEVPELARVPLSDAATLEGLCDAVRSDPRFDTESIDHHAVGVESIAQLREIASAAVTSALPGAKS